MDNMYTGTDRKQTQQVSFVLTYFANSTVALCGHSGWVELMLRPDAGRFLCWRSTERENTDRLRWGNQSDCPMLWLPRLCVAEPTLGPDFLCCSGDVFRIPVGRTSRNVHKTCRTAARFCFQINTTNAVEGIPAVRGLNPQVLNHKLYTSNSVNRGSVGA